MIFFRNPFFWALISMFGLLCDAVWVSVLKKRNFIIGFFIAATFTVGRVMLVLPFCPQPRFETNGWHWIVGSIILTAALIFWIPIFSIKLLTPPNENMQLRTTGFYAIVRNPIYLGEILFSMGLSITFRSIIGLALVPLWWVSLSLYTLLEEGSLERALGQPYLDYKKQVRGRIVPGLPT